MNFINSIRDPLTTALFNLGCLMDAAVAVGPKDRKRQTQTLRKIICIQTLTNSSVRNYFKKY